MVDNLYYVQTLFTLFMDVEYVYWNAFESERPKSVCDNKNRNKKNAYCVNVFVQNVG